VTRFVKDPEKYKPIDMQDSLTTTCITWIQIQVHVYKHPWLKHEWIRPTAKHWKM